MISFEIWGVKMTASNEDFIAYMSDLQKIISAEGKNWNEYFSANVKIL